MENMNQEVLDERLMCLKEDILHIEAELKRREGVRAAFARSLLTDRLSTRREETLRQHAGSGSWQSKAEVKSYNAIERPYARREDIPEDPEEAARKAEQALLDLIGEEPTRGEKRVKKQKKGSIGPVADKYE